MTEKTLKTRIVHKHDTDANWLKAVNFTPKQGEIIIYDIDDNYSYERFKIGDGITNVNDLPFGAISRDEVDYAIEVAMLEFVAVSESEIDALFN